MMHLLAVSRLLRNSVLGVIGITKSSASLKTLKTDAVRCLCSNVNSDQSQNAVQSSKKGTWKPIYFFPLIHIARLVNRLKLYQTIFTSALMPPLIVCYYYDMVNLTAVLSSTAGASLTCLSLYIITGFFKRLIGVIFIDNNKKELKIAHLTFWGNRKEITVPVEDIIPLEEKQYDVNDAFVKVHRHSSEEILYMTVRFGKILEDNDFQNVFGSFEVLGLKKKIV